MALYGTPRIVVNNGLLHRSFEDPAQIGPGGTWNIHKLGNTPTFATSTTSVIHGDKSLQVTNNDLGNVEGGVWQEVDYGTTIPEGETWCAHVWAFGVSGGNTVKTAIGFYDSNGDLLGSLEYSTATEIDDEGWTGVAAEKVVPELATRARIYCYGTSWTEVLYDAAALGPTASFVLPWRNYQTIDAPIARSARSAAGVTSVRHLADSYEYSILTAPEQSAVKTQMEAVAYYLARGYTFDAYPDSQDGSTAMVNLILPGGTKIAHQQSIGAPRWRWQIKAVSQGLKIGELL